jgi:hypothetical protein
MLTVTFATTRPELAIAILAVIVFCAVVVTIGSHWARHRVAYRMDVQRLMYMLREGIRAVGIFSGHVGSDGEFREGMSDLEAYAKGSMVDVVGHGQEDEGSTGGEEYMQQRAQTPNISVS